MKEKKISGNLAASTLSAMCFLFASCGSMTQQDLDRYQASQDPNTLNSGMQHIIEYTSKPVEKPEVFALALETGAALAKREMVSGDSKIQSQNEALRNRFGQHLLLLSENVSCNEQKLSLLDESPSQVSDFMKGWSLYCLSKMPADKYFYNYWETLASDQYIDDFNAQFGAVQGLLTSKSIFEKNDAMAILLLGKLARVAVAHPNKQKDLLEALAAPAVRLKTLNAALLYAQEIDPHTAVLADWACRYVHQSIDQDSLLISEVKDLEQLMYFLADLVVDKNAPRSSRVILPQLLDWAPTLLREKLSKTNLQRNDLEYMRMCLGLTAVTRKIEAIDSQELTLSINHGGSYKVLNAKKVFGDKLIFEGNQATELSVSKALPSYIKYLPVTKKEWFLNQASLLYPSLTFKYLSTVNWVASSDDMQVLQYLRYMSRLINDSSIIDEQKLALQELISELIPQVSLRKKSALIYAAIDDHLKGDAANHQYEGCVKALSKKHYKKLGHYPELLKIYITCLQEMKTKDRKAFDKIAPEASQALFLLIQEHRLDCVSLLANLAEVCGEANMLNALLDHGFKDYTKIKDTELVLVRELARRSNQSGEALREKLFHILSKQIETDNPDVSLLAVSLLMELFHEEEKYAELLQASISKRWPELLGGE